MSDEYVSIEERFDGLINKFGTTYCRRGTECTNRACPFRHSHDDPEEINLLKKNVRKSYFSCLQEDDKQLQTENHRLKKELNVLTCSSESTELLHLEMERLHLQKTRLEEEEEINIKLRKKVVDAEKRAEHLEIWAREQVKTLLFLNTKLDQADTQMAKEKKNSRKKILACFAR